MLLRRIGLWWLIAAVLGLAVHPAAPTAAQARAQAVTPALVGFAPSQGWLHEIEVMGDYAYALSEYGNQIDVFAIADPALPQLTGVYTAFTERGSFTDIALTPDYLYLSTSTQGLRVLSLADPAHPVEVGSYTAFAEVPSVTLGPGYLLVTAGLGGLRVLSLADPAHPAEIGAIGWVDSDPSLSWVAYGGVLSGRYAYVSAHNWRSSIYWRVFIVDLLDPAHPAPVAQNELRVDVETLLEVREGYGYLGGSADALSIVDLRDPAAITTTATLPDPMGEWMFSSSGALFGSYLYLGTYDGVKVIDVADPAEPHAVGAALDGAWVRDVEQRGPYIYVADQNGLSILTHGLALDRQLYLPAIPGPGQPANRSAGRPATALR